MFCKFVSKGHLKHFLSSNHDDHNLQNTTWITKIQALNFTYWNVPSDFVILINYSKIYKKHKMHLSYFHWTVFTRVKSFLAYNFHKAHKLNSDRQLHYFLTTMFIFNYLEVMLYHKTITHFQWTKMLRIL